MRFLLAFMILIHTAFTQAYVCPKQMESSKSANAGHAFLAKWPSAFTLGTCQVEIYLCQGDSSDENQNPMAEILVRDSKGREVYVPLQVPQEESTFLFTEMIVNKRTFHYEKTDKFYEVEFGRTEVTRLEMTTDWADLHKLKRLEIGIYSTHHKLDSLNGNESEWFVCEQE